MRAFACCMLLALVACTPKDAPVRASTPSAAKGQAPLTNTNWIVDQAKSSLSFSSVQSGEAFTGFFENFDVHIRFDPNNLGNSKVITIVDMFSADAGETERTNALTAKDWFYAETFPTARLETLHFTHIAGDTYEATANLTIRGITKPLPLTFVLNIEDGTAHMKSEVVFSRADYHVGLGMWRATDSIPNAVRVNIELYAVKTEP